jgi:hypothetical protein
MNRTVSCQECCSQIKYVQIMKCYGKRFLNNTLLVHLLQKYIKHRHGYENSAIYILPSQNDQV